MSSTTTRGVSAQALALSLVWCACDGDAGGVTSGGRPGEGQRPTDTTQIAAPLRDGHEAPTRLVLEPPEHLALGAFVVDGVVRCTAALIEVGHAQHFVVTAKHCFEDETDIASTRFVPLTELERDPDDARSIGIAELHLHPEVDAAVVELDQAIAGAQPFAVAELGVEDLQGHTLEVAGAGLGSGGGMRFGTFEVVAVTATRIEVRSDSIGQCAGDSGGPWFRVDGDGGGEIVAVASTSAPSCGNPAFGVRLDPLIGWISDVTRPDLAAAEHSAAVVWPASAEEGCAGSGTPLLVLGFAFALLRHRNLPGRRSRPNEWNRRSP